MLWRREKGQGQRVCIVVRSRQGLVFRRHECGPGAEAQGRYIAAVAVACGLEAMGEAETRRWARVATGWEGDCAIDLRIGRDWLASAYVC